MIASSGIEEYLEALYRLTDGDTSRHTTTSALSSQLGVSAPSVSEMLRRMSDAGLITYRPYSGAALTAAGLGAASRIVRYHRLWERFLVDMLGMPWDEVHAEACRLEHATSPLVADRLAKLLDHPETCPHGNEVPGPRGSDAPGGRTLADEQVGFEGEVASIAETPELLRYCAEAGLVPGATVRLISVDAIDHIAQVEVGQAQDGGQTARTITIGPRAARAIRVRQAIGWQQTSREGSGR
jgi:DtxR family Mn-dependent transcriptional regulator